jgi:alkylated DNA repair dioxygenase AlkB
MAKEVIHPDLFDSLGIIYTPQQCQDLLDSLISEVDWQHEYFSYGRRFDVPRLQAWYADAGVHYRYADNMLQSHPWIPLLLSIKQTVEQQAGHEFNSALVTYYRDGHDHVTWHADDEPELGEAPVIASLSLGASRELHYRHKINKEIGCLQLDNGELLIMRPKFQHQWEHAVPQQPEVVSPRINITFRKVILLRD